MDTDKLKKIIERLKSPRAYIRTKANEELLRLDDPAVIKELAKLVKDEPDFIKVHFCRFLGHFRMEEAVLPLTVLLVSDSERVSREASYALDRIKSDLKNNALITFVQRITSRFVSTYAVKSLGRDRVAKSVPYLIDLLSGDDKELKKLAIEALRQIGDLMAIHPLVRHLGKEEEDVQYSLLLALGELGGYEASLAIYKFLNNKNPELRRAAVWALAKLNYTRCTLKLVKMLEEDDNENVREEAVRRLGSLAGPSSVEPLLKAGIFDKVNNVRVYAKWSLRSLPLKEKEAPLIALTKDTDESIRGEALLELARTGERKFSTLLENALKEDKSEYVRDCAKEGLEFLKLIQKGRKTNDES